MTVSFLNRTLDQELAAIARGASFECLVCGEFLLKRPVAHACLECGTLLCDGLEIPAIRARIRGAGRVTASSWSRQAPRKVRTPQGRTLGKSQGAKADGKWNRKQTAAGAFSGGSGGKGETVG